MARTNVVKNLGELYLYGIVNPYTGNGLIKQTALEYLRLWYDTLAVDSWVVGDTVTGTNSAATGVVVAVYESGTAGYIDLDNTTGTFEDTEGLTGGSLGTTANVRINRALNPGFTSDTLWTKGTGWTIAANKASCDGSQVAVSYLTQTTAELISGEDYMVRTVVTRTAGTVTAQCGGTAGTARNAAGTYTEIITCGASGVLRYAADADFIGSVTTLYVEGPIQHLEETTRDADDVFTDADDEIIVRAVRAVMGTADTVLTLAQELGYDNDGGTPPVADEVVTGAGGAVAVVVGVKNLGGNAGTMTLKNVVGVFVNDEAITGSIALNALVNGTLTNRTATFSPGDQPDEAKQVVILGAALSPTLVTGGAAGNVFEVLRGVTLGLTVGSSDYIMYCTAKTHEEGEITIPVRDKGQLQHRKKRADVERRLSLTALYVNSKTGLLALVDQDIILIAERIDDRAGPVTEYHYYLGTRINELRMPEEAGGDDFSKVTIPARYERAYTLAG